MRQNHLRLWLRSILFSISAISCGNWTEKNSSCDLNLAFIEAVNTAHPFNQTARLKQTFWRPSPTTTTTGGGGGGFEPPALEIRQPIMHPSLQQAINDDEERLYFKVGTEHGPTNPLTFNQVVSPIVIKAKVLSVKNKAWYSTEPSYQNENSDFVPRKPLD